MSALLVGCGAKTQAPSASPEASTAYTVTDDAGRKLSFAKKPSRIVSLTYGTDEILTEVVDTKRIQAYSRWAGDNEISFITKEQAQKVGCKVHDSLENILKLEPDLVVASIATSNELVQSLEHMGIKVYIARSPHNYQEMCAKIVNLAEAVGEKAKGEALVSKMNERMQALEQRLSKLPDSKRKVAVAFNFTSAMGRRGDLLDNMMTMAHVINGAAAVTPPISEHGSVVISKEMVVGINPDVFLLPTWNFNNKQDIKGYAHAVKNDPAYRNVKAVKNDQIKFVSDKYRYVASQHVVEAIEAIAKAIYPELF
ncbi:ABC transporter substrate-binding protein [Phascolarctobacterium sp.]|uniref:ABC transporter substrate-binding protein n=1 Tax=Phascolarctobacterium sp. TaxID=2049039 RepID=UPI002A7EE8CC|nr:ABC transporter substrate-binding protein [Phascolarctobacterium sp.]MDY5045396.1 ABC transporter substrate-binding protein [Phascolarctobacterium sp.]